MPALASRTFEDITPEKWKRIQDAALVYGLNIETDAGEAHTYGAHVRWFRSPNRQLKIEIWRSAFLSVDHTLSMIAQMVENA